MTFFSSPFNSRSNAIELKIKTIAKLCVYKMKLKFFKWKYFCYTLSALERIGNSIHNHHHNVYVRENKRLIMFHSQSNWYTECELWLSFQHIHISIFSVFITVSNFFISSLLVLTFEILSRYCEKLLEKKIRIIRHRFCKSSKLKMFEWRRIKKNEIKNSISNEMKHVKEVKEFSILSMCVKEIFFLHSLLTEKASLYVPAFLFTLHLLGFNKKCFFLSFILFEFLFSSIPFQPWKPCHVRIHKLWNIH